MKIFKRIRIAITIVTIALGGVATSSASLEEILAPLPVEPVAMVETKRVQPLASQFAPQARETSTSVPQATAPVGQSIIASDVFEELTLTLQDNLRPSGDLSLVPLRDLPDLSGYTHPFTVNLMTVPERLTRGNVLLRFQVENEKGILGEWNMPFRVHLYTDVWYPRGHLRRGDLATPSDFEIRRVDTLSEPNAVPAVLESLLRHEYSRDIMPGRPLSWNDLMERALVRKGDVVEVTAVDGLLAITLRAVARQDGSDGDLILLRNLDSSKEFSARVIGENRAEVIF